MSLDVSLMVVQPCEVFTANITHNLNRMAKEAGIYQHLWRPEELGITKAAELVTPLAEGLARLKQAPEKYKTLNPENGWGNYECLVEFVKKYLQACIDNPSADVEVSR